MRILEITQLTAPKKPSVAGPEERFFLVLLANTIVLIINSVV